MKSAESASKDDFSTLIGRHEKLRATYRSLLAAYPGPIPKPLDAVRITREGPQPLSPQAQRRYEKRNAERNGLLAVHRPFMKAYWCSASCGPAHRTAKAWREDVFTLMRDLRDFCVLIRSDRGVIDFPLLRLLGGNPSLGPTEVLHAFERHIKTLCFDRDASDQQGRADVQLPAQGHPEEQQKSLGQCLREARQRSGDKLAAMNQFVKCSASTLSRIERGERKPSPPVLQQINDYIKSSS